MYTCIEAWLRRMYAAANGLTVEALVARTDTLHLTLEQVGQVINMAVAVIFNMCGEIWWWVSRRGKAQHTLRFG